MKTNNTKKNCRNIFGTAIAKYSDMKNKKIKNNIKKMNEPYKSLSKVSILRKYIRNVDCDKIAGHLFHLLEMQCVAITFYFFEITVSSISEQIRSTVNIIYKILIAGRAIILYSLSFGFRTYFNKLNLYNHA